LKRASEGGQIAKLPPGDVYEFFGLRARGERRKNTRHPSELWPSKEPIGRTAKAAFISVAGNRLDVREVVKAVL
jgi:hypothetical protein